MAIFSIPGNIKQMHLPFVLNPGADLNKVKQNEAKNVHGKPQVFSFRNSTLSHPASSSTGKLSICPQSFYDHMSKDISYKLLYKENASKEAIDLNTIFNNIPGIQIREFLPDTRLDQALDFMQKALSKFASLFTADKKASDAAKKTKSKETDATYIDQGIIDKITNVCTFAVKYLTGFTPENFYTDTFKTAKGTSVVADKGNLTTYIYKFPYIMWYELQSCTTTNLYELPCITDSKEMYSSDGTPGWPSAGVSLANRFLTSIPGIGSMIKSLLGNVNISFMPWWDAKDGTATPTPPVVVKFDLFNDTAENALYNFIFINTLIPNAKWIQYNLFQHSPHLYDIKLEGYGRLYACTGSFKVTHQGVLRNMPNSWVDSYLKEKINTCMKRDEFLAAIKSNNLIKIPDIYHVEMTFNSLLPDTFNNYLFTYSQNANITTEYMNKDVRIPSKATDLLSNGLNAMTEKLKGVWNGELNDDGVKKSGVNKNKK